MSLPIQPKTQTLDQAMSWSGLQIYEGGELEQDELIVFLKRVREPK